MRQDTNSIEYFPVSINKATRKMDAMKQVFDLGVLKPLEQVTQPASLFRVFFFPFCPGMVCGKKQAWRTEHLTSQNTPDNIEERDLDLRVVIQLLKKHRA